MSLCMVPRLVRNKVQAGGNTSVAMMPAIRTPSQARRNRSAARPCSGGASVVSATGRSAKSEVTSPPTLNKQFLVDRLPRLVVLAIGEGGEHEILVLAVVWFEALGLGGNVGRLRQEPGRSIPPLPFRRHENPHAIL